MRNKQKYLIALVLSLLVIIPSIYSLVFAFKDEPTGFRGIKWGSSFEQIPGELKTIVQFGKSNWFDQGYVVCWYERKKDENNDCSIKDFNKGELLSYTGRDHDKELVGLYFIKNKFFFATASISSSGKATLDSLIKRHGGPDMSLEGLRHRLYVWRGKKTILFFIKANSDFESLEPGGQIYLLDATRYPELSSFIQEKKMNKMKKIEKAY